MLNFINYLGLTRKRISHMTRKEIDEYSIQREKKIKAIADCTFAECKKQGLKIADLECVIKELQDKIEILEEDFKCSSL